MGSIEGKVALITGGAGGIGTATAALFEAEGAIVIRADIPRPGEAFPPDLIPLDVTDEAAWAAAAAEIGRRHERLDILVNNAGIFEVAGVQGTSIEMFERTMRINVTGVFLGMKHAIPLLRRASGGAIVNLSSVAGLVGGAGTIAYSASKWAVRGMTKVAAAELAADNIRVNSVHPGIIDTAMTRTIAGDPTALHAPPPLPMARKGEANEVARMILFLASDASSYSTGAEFICDGGLSAS